MDHVDHVTLEALGDTASDYIESKLRFLAIEMLFELCRLQKLSGSQLSARVGPTSIYDYSSSSPFLPGVFTDTFIDDLFDLVENSRSNEMLSYSVIRFLVREFPMSSCLICLTRFRKVCLNEQFMVESVHSLREGPPMKNRAETAASGNRVLKVLMRRLQNSKTFGENLIFMLNRAGATIPSFDNVGTYPKIPPNR